MPNLLSFLPKRLRVLSVLIMVTSLAFVVRVGDAAMQVRSLTGGAQAAEGNTSSEKQAEKPASPSKEENASAEAGRTQPPSGELKEAGDVVIPEKKKSPSGAKPGPESAAETKEGDAKKWSDASEAESDYSTVRKEMYQDLLQRRQQLDEKEKALSEREALIEAGQKEIDRKFQELSGLRDEIRELLKTQSKEEEARISSLVKIYEGMKPKDAARIFNTLDMDVLLQVVSRMGERKSGAILAVMEADRAKALTNLLAEQKTLPDVPDSPLDAPSQ